MSQAGGKLLDKVELFDQYEGKKYVVKVEKDVRLENLSKYLLQYDPLILHFSGHGSAEGNIILNDDRGQPQTVSPDTLAELLSAIDRRIECLVLNACFSLEKADALLERVNCIVGMSKEIDDKTESNSHF